MVMMKYKTLCLAAVGIMAVVGVHAAPSRSNRSVTQGQTGGSSSSGMQSSAQSGMQAGQSMGDCSAMTADEQQFANQIVDPKLKMMFCTKFTPDQRNTAMQSMNQPDAQGNMMSADQSVQKVMKDNNMTMPMMQQQQQRSGAGGCPVSK